MLGPYDAQRNQIGTVLFESNAGKSARGWALQYGAVCDREGTAMAWAIQTVIGGPVKHGTRCMYAKPAVGNVTVLRRS